MIWLTCFSGGALTRGRKAFHGLSRVRMHYYCCTAAPPIHPCPPSYTPIQAGDTTSCHAPVINFHAPAGRCVAFVRIYGVTRPLGRRVRRDSGGERMGRSRSRGSRERLIFQGNTWRYFGLYSVGNVCRSWFCQHSIARNELPNFFLSSSTPPYAHCKSLSCIRTYTHTINSQSWNYL